MRKTIFKPSAILILGLVLSISCNKNQQDVIVNSTDQTGFSIAAAKQWYTTNFSNKQAGSVSNKSNKKIGIFSPLWAQSVNGGDDNYEVVETPLVFDHTPGFSLSANTANDINGITKLLVLKSKRSGRILSALMHIFSKSGLEDKNVTYSKIPAKFTGNIFFTDLEGTFINGWQYEDGKIVRKSNKEINAANPAGKVLPPDEGGCQTVEVFWYARDCQEVAYNSGVYTCGPWQYTGSTYETYCTSPAGGGGGGGGYGGGDAAAIPKLCSLYAFAIVGNSYTASIKYLLQVWQHQAPPYENIWTNFIESCLTIPTYGITPQQASEIFNTVFNNATNTVIDELKSGALPPYSGAISKRMKSLIQTGLHDAKPGAVWSTSLCLNNVPSTEAAWCQ